MTEPIFSFGLITDCQYADIPDDSSFADRRFSLSLKKLSEAIDFFNEQDLAFVVHLGDLIDQDIKSFDTILPVCATSKADFWHVLGNHDFMGADYTHNVGKTSVLKKLGLQSGYYSKVVEDCRFIVLNTNEEGIIESVEGTKEWHEGMRILGSYKGRINAQDWNGRISQVQQKWMLEELKSADDSGQRVIMFSHHGLYPAHRENMLNDIEMVEELSKYKAVKAYINGHNHDGDYGIYSGMHCLTVHGMLDTAENSYAVVDIYDDRLEIKGYGREPSRKLMFR